MTKRPAPIPTERFVAWRHELAADEMFHMTADEARALLALAERSQENDAERILAIKEMAKARNEAMDVRNAYEMDHYLVEAEERGGQFAILYNDNRRLRAELAAVKGSLPDDLRALGWSVAVHNDYRLHGEHHTFWLLTKDGRALKGEGRTDWQALNQIRAQMPEVQDA